MSDLQIQNEAVGISDSAGTIAEPISEAAQNRSRMFLEGTTQVSQNIERLTGSLTAANTALMDLAITPDETILQIEKRLESNRETDGRSLAILHKAQAMATSLHAELLSKEGQSLNFEAIEGRRSEAEVRQSYETEVSGLVEISARKHRISRPDALKLVEQEIAMLGVDSVLPIFARIRNRYLGLAPTPPAALPAPAPAPTAVEIAQKNLADAEAAAATA